MLPYVHFMLAIAKFREFCVSMLSLHLALLKLDCILWLHFPRITVFAGDTESSHIPGLVGLFLPSVLIAILGFMAKKLLDIYGENLEEDDCKKKLMVIHLDKVLTLL